jgi:hypothetical protein
MRFEAVRWSFEGASFVMVGHGMPSVTLGSGAAELGFHSLKLGERASAHNEVVIDEIRKGRMVPSTRSGAAALGIG